MRTATLAISGLMLLWACGCGGGGREEYDLEILTPHNDQIQSEFEQAFEAYVGRDLNIRWTKLGTGEVMEFLGGRDKGDETFGFDIFFGGGVPDHDRAAARGWLQKPELSAELLGAIPKSIAGVSNLDEDGLWYGAALSSFGILVHEDNVAKEDLPPVRGWADLCQPPMLDWVVIADPRRSSSVRVCYELVLQQHGWEDGWPLLMQMAANARDITASSSQVPNMIAGGNVLAGPCIDFYAFGQIAKHPEGGLAYVPASAITPDPISMLRKPPHKELAEEFITFVLSEEGQRLWFLPAGAEGGPKTHSLFRMPVRGALVDTYKEQHPDLPVQNPYKQVGQEFQPIDDDLQTLRSELLAELMGAGLVDLKDELRDAWEALVQGGMKPAALEEWRKLPFSREESLEIARKLNEAAEAGGTANARQISEMTREWIDFFREKYRRVTELSR